MATTPNADASLDPNRAHNNTGLETPRDLEREEDYAKNGVTGHDSELNSELFGQMRIGQKQTSYIGSSHWATILSDV